MFYDPTAKADPFELQDFMPWLSKADITAPSGKDIYSAITSEGLDQQLGSVWQPDMSNFSFLGDQAWDPYSSLSLENEGVRGLYTQALGQTQDSRLMDAYKSAMGFDQYKPDPYANTSFGGENYGLSVGQLGLDFSKMFEAPEFVQAAKTWATEQTAAAQQKDARGDLMSKLYTDPKFIYQTTMEDWKNIAKGAEDYVADWNAKNLGWNTSSGGDSLFNMPPSATPQVGYLNGVPVYANALTGAPRIGAYYSVDSSGKLTYGVGKKGKGGAFKKAIGSLMTGGISDIVQGSHPFSSVGPAIAEILPDNDLQLGGQVLGSMATMGATQFEAGKERYEDNSNMWSGLTQGFDAFMDPGSTKDKGGIADQAIRYVGEKAVPDSVKPYAATIGGVIGNLALPGGGGAGAGAGVGAKLAGMNTQDAVTSAAAAAAAAYILGGYAKSDLSSLADLGADQVVGEGLYGATTLQDVAAQNLAEGAAAIPEGAGGALDTGWSSTGYLEGTAENLANQATPVNNPSWLTENVTYPFESYMESEWPTVTAGAKAISDIPTYDWMNLINVAISALQGPYEQPTAGMQNSIAGYLEQPTAGIQARGNAPGWKATDWKNFNAKMAAMGRGGGMVTGARANETAARSWYDRYLQEAGYA
jgi:hypothetical protein